MSKRIFKVHGLQMSYLLFSSLHRIPLSSARVIQQQVLVCRSFSQKNIIRWPKNFPGTDESRMLAQSIKTKNRKNSKGTSKVSAGTGFIGIEGATAKPQLTSEVKKDYDSEEVLETRLQANPESTWHQHFDDSDAGFSGTRIINSKHTDRFLKDAKTGDLLKKESRVKENISYKVNENEVCRDISVSKETETMSVVEHSEENDYREGNESDSHTEGRQPMVGETRNKEVNEYHQDVKDETCGNVIMSRKQEVMDDQLLHRKCPPHDKVSKRYKKLNIDPKHEILYGISPCLLALQQKRRQLSKAFVLEAFKNSARPEAQTILKELSEMGVVMYETHRGELNKLSNGKPHQGICLEVSPLHFETLSKISSELLVTPADSKVCILALDQIMDPMNLGAVMRSAYFLGVDRVVASKYKCCPLTPTVSKASSGISEVMPIYAASNMESFLQELGNLGWQILGATSKEHEHMTDLQKPVLPCSDLQLTKPTVLVMGSEGFGLRRSLQAKCDTFVTIAPGRSLLPHIDSLNVSVATGILLHSLLRNR